MTSSRILPAVLSLSLLAGCTSVKTIQDFGKATKSLSDSASTGYKEFSQRYTSIVNKGHVLNGQDVTPDQLDGKLDPKAALDSRLAALDQLAKYATALEALASKDFTGDIKSASDDLVGSLKGLNKASGSSGVSDQDLATIGGIVAALADVYVEAEREKALRRIIIAADPGVQKAGKRVAEEFPEFGSSTATQAELTATSFLLKANDKNRDVSQRLDFVAQAEDLRHVENTVPAAYKALAEGAKKVFKTHATLANAARGGKLTTKESNQAIADLFEKAKAVKKLFDDVSKPSAK